MGLIATPILPLGVTKSGATASARSAAAIMAAAPLPIRRAPVLAPPEAAPGRPELGVATTAEAIGATSEHAPVSARHEAALPRLAVLGAVAPGCRSDPLPD